MLPISLTCGWVAKAWDYVVMHHLSGCSCLLSSMQSSLFSDRTLAYVITSRSPWDVLEVQFDFHTVLPRGLYMQLWSVTAWLVCSQHTLTHIQHTVVQFSWASASRNSYLRNLPRCEMVVQAISPGVSIRLPKPRVLLDATKVQNSSLCLFCPELPSRWP